MTKNIGGLWKNTDKNKKTAFYGVVNGVKVAVFPNKDKKKPNQPDYIVCETKPKKVEYKDIPDSVPGSGTGIPGVTVFHDMAAKMGVPF